MATLPERRIAELLEPFYPQIGLPAHAALVSRLSAYLDLLMKWNARMNLSAIREPAGIVERHFGESLFTALHLPACRTALDLGSGAGFPGLPIALARPEVEVTLAESQNKKAAFLREAVRVLEADVEIWPQRVEEMPPERLFDAVTLRAVDRPLEALRLARERLQRGGYLVQLGSREAFADAEEDAATEFRIPGSERRMMRIGL